MSGDDSLSAFEARLAALKRRMEAGLPARAEALSAGADALAQGQPEARDEVRRLAHKLRGIAGSYGHDALSKLAAQVERAAKDEGVPPEEVVALARQLAERARAVGEAGGPPPAGAGTAARSPAEDTVTAPTAAPAPAAPAPVGPTRALVVEDDPATAKLLALTLERLGGWETRVAASGDAALALLADGPVGLVLCDAMMPGMTGLELCRHLREGTLLPRSTPIVMLSAASPEELGVDLTELACTAWLRKPVSPRHLVETLKGILGAP